MSDEKLTIYISPEEDLTSVRERLEKLSARFITLVIPTETQLRSHVAWKLLRARVRELGKEVQIVSDSAQVRSVARDVNFKVASSLEAAPTGKSRPPSRSGRGPGGKGRPTGSIQRPLGRRSTSLRSPEATGRWLPTDSRPFEPLSSEHAILEDDDLSHDAAPSSAPSFNDNFPMTPEKGQDFGFQRIGTSPSIRPLSPGYLDEEPDLWSEDFREAQNIRESASQSGISVPETSGPTEHFDRDEESPSSENRFLREAGQPYRMTPFPDLGNDPIDSMDDALPPPPGQLEQRGAAPALENFETQEHTIMDVPDIPTDVFHGIIEDQGDQGDFVAHSDTPSTHELREPIAEDEQDRAGPARPYGIRPRSSRTGRRSSPQPQLPPVTPGLGFDSDDDLPSVTELPTRMTPQTPPIQPAASGTSRTSKQLPPQEIRRSGGLPSMPLSRRSGGLSQGNQGTGKSGALPPAPSRVSGAISPQNKRPSSGLAPAARMSGNLPQNPTRSGTLSPEQARQSSRQLRPGTTPGTKSGGSSPLTTTGRNRAVLSRPGTRPGRGAAPSRQGSPARPNTKRASRRRSPVPIIIAAVAVLIIVTLALLYWLLPTATVAITLPSQSYSVPVKLVANPSNQTGAGIVQETILNKDFTTSGTGNATGTTKVGTATAHGTVLFTNNSNQQITIPSNILLSTSNGTQFVTEDNIALGPKNSALSSQPSFIDAQAAGTSGNVPAHSITIIPANTMKLIQQYNSTVSPSAISLQVTNDAPTTGGGVGSAISVTQKDLDTTQSTLSAQLQNSVNTWLQQQLTPGDVAGKPVITPTLTNAPKVNTIEQDKTFSATLKESVQVAVVRGTALQAATVAQLNTALSQDKKLQNYQVVPDSRLPVQIPQFTPVSNGLSLTLNFKPTGTIVPKFSKDAVQTHIVSQSPAEVETTLKSLIPGIQKVQVTLSPSFLPVTPLRSDNIHIQFDTVGGTPTGK